MQSENVFSDATRHLVRIAAAIAGAPIAVVRRVMTEVAQASSPAIAAEVEEVLLQSYLFAGFPRTLNAVAVWREVSQLAAPASDDAAGVSHASEWSSRGEATCQIVYSDRYDVLRANVRALHPALDAWMVVDGYGKVLSRPGLSLARRELCIVAACAAAEQQPQLRSHLWGAINAGATLDDLGSTLTALTDVVSRDALASAREGLTRLREA